MRPRTRCHRRHTRNKTPPPTMSRERSQIDIVVGVQLAVLAPRLYIGFELLRSRAVRRMFIPAQAGRRERFGQSP